MTPTPTIIPTVGFVGNLTDDPILQFGKSGTAWMRARISVQPYVKGQAEKPEPEFFDLVCFGTLAENVCEVARKGDRLVVRGRLESETWTGRDGMERTSQKIVCDGIGLDLRFAGSGATRSTPTLAPTPTPASTGITALVGPAVEHDYAEMPF
jgi:single stranded DNA-binding protein